MPHDSPLPDEDAFALTADQLGTRNTYVHGAIPRRGRPSATDFTLREDHVEWWRERGIRQRRGQLRKAAAEPAGDPDIRASLLSYIDGSPDPVGAAAAFWVDVTVGTGLWGLSGYSQFDAWMGEHGPEFATAAVMEYYSVQAVNPRNGYQFDPRLYDDEPIALLPVPADPVEAPWRLSDYELLRLRTYLSTLAEPEYRRLEAVLETQGRNTIQRAARAYLMSERTDWVDETCADRATWRLHHHCVLRWLFECVGSMDQLAKAGITTIPNALRYPWVYYTLLEGIGLDCTPLLVAAAAEETDPKSRHREHLFPLLATLPRDESVMFLLGGIAEYRTWDLVQEIADRFPVRTLRAIAALADGSDTAQRARFIGLIQSKPLLHGPAHEALNAEDRDKIDALLEWRDRPNVTDDLPAALVEPPRPAGGRRVPKAPEWAPLVAATPILTRGGRSRLPQSSVAHVLTAMALDSIDSPFAGLAEISEHCDPASLRECSWGVFEAWALAGGPPKHNWAFTQLARFADDDTVWRLENLIYRWPGEGLHKRAVKGLDLLGAIGTEEALNAVHRVSKRAGYKGIKKAALAAMDQIAAGLGLDQDQLLDRLVPDFELDSAGRMTLDYGPRQFQVGFDEQLKPFVIDVQGKARKSLPKPVEADDPEAAVAAAARFDQLKRSLKSVGTEQVKRLERAMVAGRVWSASDFGRYLAGHALMWHLTRRLVWQFESGGEWTSFRVAEDRTLAGVDDEALTLPEGAAVRLPHPLLLGDDVVRWAEVFADYELVQPFEQLSRPVMAFTAEELATGRLSRLEGAKVPVGPLIGLQRNKGWRYSDALADPYEEQGLCLEIPEIGFVMLGLDPGIEPYYPSGHDHHVMKRIQLSKTEDQDGPVLTGLDPVAASEILVQLDRIASPR
jgi:hypothetical protein